MRPLHRMAIRSALAAGLLALAALARAQPTLAVEDPRAFGWQIGDKLERRLVLLVPPGYRLDLESLPTPAQGSAIELRRVERDGAADDARQTLHLHYQVLRSAPQPALYELPAVRLRVLAPGAEARVIDLRVDAMPLLVEPMTPIEAPQRSGLGELRPDAEPQLLPVARERALLLGCAVVAALLLGWLLLWPRMQAWLMRRRRPFARAERAVRLALRGGQEPARIEAAMHALHAAFDAHAGRVLLATDAAAQARASAWPVPLADDVTRFFEASSRHFFGSVGDSLAGREPGLGATELRDLARRLSAAERQAAGRAGSLP
ncbi:hypothetical protein [Rivibacter subsaxonicus]|uniref:MxaA protein n=1 Tax=Rivibacter subsaxonicus TaxID=457575 RepID=A0A4Q7VD75_9BURK|nr:hypothetical protein [Rivibacter subsaxonicus]RZT93814.1 mxaA protein [Rivibacter subsaxonicus]